MKDQPSDFGGLSFSRIVVVGANGAGKTWLAQRLGLPVISKDALALTTGWQQRPYDTIQVDIARLINAKRWVLEGGPSILSMPVLARAELVVWLDLPAFLRFRRVVWRSIRYAGRTRPEHPPGNRDWPGPRQWRFAWRAFTGGKGFRAAITRALHGTEVPVVRLQSVAEVDLWLRSAREVAGQAGDG
ncbi:DNA topology modulation protein FlaR [Yoonia sp. 2307UL14-13]|uniref:DNA topology modulation protein FlaR n=1 Tax=Yoonia sp. 2307UL14-13 TaxID=3126506 RepID=UPI0030B017E7